MIKSETALKKVVGWAVINTSCNCIEWTGYTKPLLVFTNREAAENWLAKHSNKNREIQLVYFTPHMAKCNSPDCKAANLCKTKQEEINEYN